MIVHHDEIVLLLAGRIQDEDALAQADLGRRQPDALALAHPIEHPRDDGAQVLVEGRDRLRDLAEHGIGVEDDFEFGDLGHRA